VYPEGAACPFEFRSMEQPLNDVEIVKESLQPVHGILGPTPLAILPEFDLIKAFISEYMHSCCQGCLNK